MSELKIPFAPLPAQTLRNIARRFVGIGSRFAKLSPSLEEELDRAQLYISKNEYGAIMFLMSTFYFILATLITFAFAQKFAPENAIVLSLIVGVLFSGLILFQLVFYPKVILKKKIRDLERNLVFALRTILVEIKSGVTMFDAINIVAEGDNGEVSREFKRAVQNIQTGEYQNEALEYLAEKNPSLHFRRAIWQLVNGLKAGSDTSVVMQALVENLSKEKSNQVRKYGNSLKLLSLLYMMLGAIIPALGLTFLIILSTFPQIAISEEVFWGMLGFIVLGQFMYLGIIKSSRPTLLGD